MDEFKEKEEILFKVLIIGDSTVGKTSLVQRYVNNCFRPNYKGTIGVDFAIKMIDFKDKIIKLQLWDIAGQDRFASMTRIYYKNADGCLVLFDVTQKFSLWNSANWKADLDEKCFQDDGTKVPCLLLGNKCDLPTRSVDQSVVEDICRDHAFVGWTEVSVKDNLMVDECFKYLIDMMLEKRWSKLYSTMYTTSHIDSINLRSKSQYDINKYSHCSC